MGKPIKETEEMLALAVFHMETEQMLLERSVEYRELQEKANESICKLIPHNALARFSKNPSRLESLSYTMGNDHVGATKELTKKGFDMQLGGDFFVACKSHGISTKALRGDRR